MVEDRLTDGKRIAQFVASEVEGHEELPLSVADADPDVEPTEDGAFAYRIVRSSGALPATVVIPSTSAVCAATMIAIASS